MKYFLYSLVFTLFNFSFLVTAKATDIVVTLPPMAGLVHLLEPDAKVACLLSANADPHHFQLSPRQIESLQQSDLLIRSSVDDGHWPSLPYTGKQLDLWPRKGVSSAAKHAWLNPKAVQMMLPKLAAQLEGVYPNHKEEIQQRLNDALNEVERIWREWQQIASVKKLSEHGVIMQHPAWTSLFQALQIPIQSSLESEQHGHEHGPRKLEKALRLLQGAPQIRLIADSNHSNRALQWLQDHHSSSQMTTLDALGLCGEPWTELMQRNLNAFQQ